MFGGVLLAARILLTSMWKLQENTLDFVHDTGDLRALMRDVEMLRVLQKCAQDVPERVSIVTQASAPQRCRPAAARTAAACVHRVQRGTVAGVFCDAIELGEQHEQQRGDDVDDEGVVSATKSSSFFSPERLIMGCVRVKVFDQLRRGGCDWTETTCTLAARIRANRKTRPAHQTALALAPDWFLQCRLSRGIRPLTFVCPHVVRPPQGSTPMYNRLAAGLLSVFIGSSVILSGIACPKHDDKPDRFKCPAHCKKGNKMGYKLELSEDGAAPRGAHHKCGAGRPEPNANAGVRERGVRRRLRGREWQIVWFKICGPSAGSADFESADPADVVGLLETMHFRKRGVFQFIRTPTTNVPLAHWLCRRVPITMNAPYPGVRRNIPYGGVAIAGLRKTMLSSGLGRASRCARLCAPEQPLAQTRRASQSPGVGAFSIATPRISVFNLSTFPTSSPKFLDTANAINIEMFPRQSHFESSSMNSDLVSMECYRMSSRHTPSGFGRYMRDRVRPRLSDVLKRQVALDDHSLLLESPNPFVDPFLDVFLVHIPTLRKVRASRRLKISHLKPLHRSFRLDLFLCALPPDISVSQRVAPPNRSSRRIASLDSSTSPTYCLNILFITGAIACPCRSRTLCEAVRSDLTTRCPIPPLLLESLDRIFRGSHLPHLIFSRLFPSQSFSPTYFSGFLSTAGAIVYLKPSPTPS
ncbi:hypothetical protein B0H11DRAFT_1942038 [Mycena galericulata]|nr:hypothetical protein B0H11DRAFT_1942038 [Mycena galericulata]